MTILQRLYSFVTGNERAQGIDISRYEGFFIPSLRVPIHFAFQKLTEGTGYVDLLLDEIWEGVKFIDVRGGYHYQRSGLSWEAQARHYLATALRHDYHIHALDIEEINNTYSDSFFADSRRIIDLWRAESGGRVVVYTNASTYVLFAAAIKRQYTDYQVWLDDLDFWYAWPSKVAPSPWLPQGRLTWRFWQYAWDGKKEDYGTGGAVDLNIYNGPPDELKAWAGVIQTPPEEEPMEEVYVTGLTTASAGLRVRSAPVSGPVLGSLPLNTPIEGWLLNGWIRGTFNGLTGYVSADWVAWGVSAEPEPNKAPVIRIETEENNHYPAYSFEMKPK